MAKEIIKVPDIGGSENVDVIEVSVAPGDVIAVEDTLVVLESDKASMDVPSPKAGKVISVLLKEGDTCSEGDALIELETEGAGEAESEPAQAPAPAAEAPKAEPEVAPAPAAQSGGKLVVPVPDLGGDSSADVIEICVAVGDDIEEGDSLIVLESDKASMEVPSPASGKVVSISIKEGAKASEGDEILILESTSAAAPQVAPVAEAPAAPVPAAAPKASSGPSIENINVPDLGGDENVDVIEVCVAEGDEIAEGDSLIVLESDKASMEVPSPKAGKIIKLTIAEGDKVSVGHPICQLQVEGGAAEAEPAIAAPAADVSVAVPQVKSSRPTPSNELHPQFSSSDSVYAGPAVRKMARELGVDLSKVPSSGPKGRLNKDDVNAYVKSIMQGRSSAPASAPAAGTSGIPPIPEVDFSQWGDIELQKMSKIKKLTAANMTRNWLNVPHVTQFDDADITDLEAFRKDMKAQAEKAGVKLTPLPFLLKACAAALKYEPSFNVSMHADGEHIVQKKYVHIGVAVATPAGLVVPVIRDVDKKGIYELAKESTELANKAREGKLKPAEMQGGCFTISSLGPIGGTGFTPIVNAPEVAILGVSKASIKPVWNGKEFEPRQMLPLCLSYDHRAINGADAGRFFTYLSSILGDLRQLIL
ncbi:pyruvate dehydrogenase complex dihydrolipoyllysine-residue acetyltransferase [Teredinibacter sp. KSP-S5-2]|uniref:pyruvate dehydrogenase complex dihydrolipoyllysine-residue acetyltransferase n=1 Tax=Teredinibacter sp. KSP-S5-2 TaxID=3034506 RepID=UPI00293455A6|nr:pyruvate dehydrogenase complex dihydrolipoyllysine-residue acetyltransferase [Teredinibacter sp. KSP-S5-2]WNO09848.1 pyruvate dehydrogenase complex dihydrolipoyllysine-residue acetyltransferase [Teredinibacter sp. KSP-S5-2]